jgi:hypothetical protein
MQEGSMLPTLAGEPVSFANGATQLAGFLAMP